MEAINGTKILERTFDDYVEAVQFYEETKDFTWEPEQSLVLLKETWERICTVPLKREDY